MDGCELYHAVHDRKRRGAVINVSTPAVRELSDGVRLVFRAGAILPMRAERSRCQPSAATYTAAYVRQNRLSLEATPAEGASFSIAPSSPDGFYDEGTLVAVLAKPGFGFRILGWTGDISGGAVNTAVTLDSPKVANLHLDRVPAIAPSGIRSAVTATVSEDVAPGSLISIFGANLAPGVRVGPANPLAQTLENVTVRADDTFLPLIFVSPGQITRNSRPVSLKENTPSSFGGKGSPKAARRYRLSGMRPGCSISVGTINPWVCLFAPMAARLRRTARPAR